MTNINPGTTRSIRFDRGASMHRRIKSPQQTPDAVVTDQEQERVAEIEWRQAQGMDRRNIMKSMGLAAVLGAGAVGALAGCTSSSSATSASKEAKAGKPIKLLDVGFGDVIPWCVQITNSTKFW